MRIEVSLALIQWVFLVGMYLSLLDVSVNQRGRVVEGELERGLPYFLLMGKLPEINLKTEFNGKKH